MKNIFYGARRLLAISLLFQALGLLVLNYARTLGGAVGFILLFGPGYGGVITLRLTLQAEYFGRKTFGSLQGITMGISIIGTMSFPLRSFERFSRPAAAQTTREGRA